MEARRGDFLRVPRRKNNGQVLEDEERRRPIVLDAQGTNDYELPHGYIESKPIVEELNDVSSDEDERCCARCASKTPKECSLALSIKKIQKVSNARFFSFVYYCDAPQVYIKSSKFAIKNTMRKVTSHRPSSFPCSLFCKLWI